MSALKSEGREFQVKGAPSTSSLRKEGAWPMCGAAKGQYEAKGSREGHEPETKSEEQCRRLTNLME